MSEALIVIDMQNGLKDIYQRDQVIKKVNQRIDHYRNERKPLVFLQHIDENMPIFSREWSLFDDLHNQVTDRYFNKYRPDSFYQTGLESFLKLNKISSIELCGAQTEYCVDTTIRVAFHIGFQISILKDGFSTFDNEILTAKQVNQHHLHIWQGSFAKIVEA
ncbi:cysteine hydrolase [Oenococcus sp. UCMA 16435]|nr:cysteine hydrolase [Oenococcus sp. UCMA 16435]MDN6968569.1 cysteine hydrolase [Oenococcus sp. UCMA 17063]